MAGVYLHPTLNVSLGTSALLGSKSLGRPEQYTELASTVGCRVRDKLGIYETLRVSGKSPGSEAFAVISVGTVLISPPFPLCGCSCSQRQNLAYSALKASPGSDKASADFRRVCSARTHESVCICNSSLIGGLSPPHPLLLFPQHPRLRCVLVVRGAVCSVLGAGTGSGWGRTGTTQPMGAPKEESVGSPTLSPRQPCLGNTHLPLGGFDEQHRGFVAFTARVEPAEMDKGWAQGELEPWAGCAGCPWPLTACLAQCGTRGHPCLAHPQGSVCPGSARVLVALGPRLCPVP